MLRRFIGTTVVLALLGLAGFGAATFGRTLTSAPIAAVATQEIQGRLVLPLDAGLSVLELPSLKESRLLEPDRGASVTSATWSPMGNEIAYGYFHRKPGDSTTSAEIFLIDAAGGQPRLIVERDTPGAQMDFPAWSPDGRTLYFSTLKQEERRFISRVERVELASGQRSVVTEGYAPWVSRDSKHVSFLRDSRLGQELWVIPAEGGEPQQLIPGGRFTAITSPRFTPDSKSIVFAGANPVGTAEGPRGILAALFDVPVAYAHGDPFDLWIVPTTGGEPTKLAVSGEDEPALAWSPDGQQLAMYAPGGIYQFEVRTGASRKLSDRGGYGGIDWVK